MGGAPNFVIYLLKYAKLCQDWMVFWGWEPGLDQNCPGKHLGHEF